jgi:hypothetical protein
LAQPSSGRPASTPILLAPRHGREAGYSAELFKHISPRLIIISGGSYGDTSAKARGWTVHKRSTGGTETRYCVSTRNDDYVTLKLGMNGETPFIRVGID